MFDPSYVLRLAFHCGLLVQDRVDLRPAMGIGMLEGNPPQRRLGDFPSALRGEGALMFGNILSVTRDQHFLVCCQEHLDPFPRVGDQTGGSARRLADGEREPSRQEVVELPHETRTDVMINYCAVGSQKATEFYAERALEAGVAFVNCIRVFIGSDPEWGKSFEKAGDRVIGDDIKAQLGATIVQRVLTDLFRKRWVKLERTYQLNTDFLNMLEHSRPGSKKISKTEAVQRVAQHRLDPENIHIGPSACRLAE